MADSKNPILERKQRGAYYTPVDLSKFVLRWVTADGAKSLLEPSCGNGVFLDAINSLESHELKHVSAFEIDESEAYKAEQKVKSISGLDSNVFNQDFIGWAIKNLMFGRRFDGIVGNPPYIKYQSLSSSDQSAFKEIFRFFHLKFTKHTNAWVPFVIASVALLNPGGRLGMVLPSEIMNVSYAAPLREFLLNQSKKILIIDSNELWFDDALQGTVILLFEKANQHNEKTQGIDILQVDGREFLKLEPEDIWCKSDFQYNDQVKKKWIWASLSAYEYELINGALNSQNLFLFNDIAEVSVGILTGANAFFVVTDDDVKQHSLESWAHPVYGQSKYVNGVVYDADRHNENRANGLATNLIWFQEDIEVSDPAYQYIKLGEDSGFHNSYKCRIRNPWYTIPSVFSTPISMPKRSHHMTQLVLNRKQAFVTNASYRVSVKEHIDPKSLVFSFTNSLTMLHSELEGRSYGGGVLELVPSEIRRVSIPYTTVNEDDLWRLHYAMQTMEATDILENQDRFLLDPIFTQSEIDTFHGIWERLKAKRQRLVVSSN